MDPRTGKTKATLDAIGILALKGEVSRVVVVTTLDGIGVWEDEIEQHWPFTAVVKSHGEAVVKIGNSAPVVKFYILNYEQFRKRSRDRSRWVYPVSRAIERWRPDMMVFDESHRIKRAGGVTAQLAWRSVQRMRTAHTNDRPYVLLLTGTPNPKGWQDLFAQFRALDPGIFGTAKAEFEERYCEYGIGSRRYTVVGYHRLPELKRKFRAHSFSISEEKAFPDMPAQLWQNVLMSLPPEARRIYNEMAEEFVADFDGGVIEASNAGARRTRLLQITGGFTTQGDVLHTAKVDTAKSIFAGLKEAGEAFVVYARFIPEVEALDAALDGAGIPARVITGAVSRADRRVARTSFRHGDTQALLFQIQAGSEAIDLSTAHEVVYYSLPDGWLYYWQSSRRVRGPRQQHATRFRHILARGTLDRSVLATLQVKGDMHAELMRSPRAFLLPADDGMIQYD
jgi:SNF2-related domain/Helicase conserved C-terminal domain